jgi:hypothetical protein
MKSISRALSNPTTLANTSGCDFQKGQVAEVQYWTVRSHRKIC